MNPSNPNFVGWTAIIGGVVGIISFISLLLLFVVGEPFGTLNDILSIPIAFLLVPFIFALYRLNAPNHSSLSLLALLVGIAGFFITAIGSGLLVLNRITFDQSLLAGIGGFGLIGLWVLINSVLGLTDGTLARGLAWLGVLIGITPTLALIAVFRTDSIASMLTGLVSEAGSQISPLGYALLLLGGLSYAALPVWFLLVGRLFVSGRFSILIGTAPV